jgi:small subunit ribosomal protein S3
MGQKIHPTGFRLSISRNWSSRWYASNKDFAGMLAEDIKVREYLKLKLKNASAHRASSQECPHHHFLGSSGCCDR